MNLWKKFFNASLTGTTKIPKNSTLTAESGSTVTLAGTANMSGTLQVGGTAVTSSAAELNILTGVTAAAAELNYNDITTLGTGAASKAVVLNASGDYTYPASATIVMPSGGTETFQSGSTLDVAGTFQIGGVTVDATAAELNRATDISTRIVTTTATTLALTVTQHAERVVLINTNSTVANTFTLPAATGSGAKFTLINGIAQTQGTIVVAANGTDVFAGGVHISDTTAETAAGFLTSATSDKYTFNLTTMGGLGADKVEAWDVAANTWQVQITAFGSGTLATGFAAT